MPGDDSNNLVGTVPVGVTLRDDTALREPMEMTARRKVVKDPIVPIGASEERRKFGI